MAGSMQINSIPRCLDWSPLDSQILAVGKYRIWKPQNILNCIKIVNSKDPWGWLMDLLNEVKEGMQCMLVKFFAHKAACMVKVYGMQLTQIVPHQSLSDSITQWFVSKKYQGSCWALLEGPSKVFSTLLSLPSALLNLSSTLWLHSLIVYQRQPISSIFSQPNFDKACFPQ